MRPNQLIEEIGKLDLSEKLILVEDIWDSIALSNSELPLPEWQKIELDKRYKEYKGGTLTLHDWKEVHEELRMEEVIENYGLAKLMNEVKQDEQLSSEDARKYYQSLKQNVVG